MIALDRPFQKGWERTRGMLFAPFRVGVWLRLGFVAWLASFLAGGTSLSVSYPGRDATSGDPGQLVSWVESVGTEWVILVICGGLLVAGLVLIVLFWIGARAQFMLLDNVIRGTADVAGPWRRFRVAGNDFFRLYTVLVSIPAIVILLLAAAALAAFWPDLVGLRAPGFARLWPWLLAGLACVAFATIWSLAMLVYREFGVPIMFASGCSAREALVRVGGILRTRPADSALYLLVRLALGVGFFMAAVAVVVLTCCLGALPYVNSVLTLPIAVFRQAFVLDCLGQLAPEYRWWRDGAPPEIPPLP